MHPTAQRFTVYITWADIPNTDSTGAYIHEPILTYWAGESGLDLSQLSIPSVTGFYSGDIDRTIIFRVVEEGDIGVTDSVGIRYEIDGEPQWNNILNVGANYTPGETVDAIFKLENTSTTLDLGLQLSFTAGPVGLNGEFKVGCEDFEGFHIWRGIEPDGSDLTVIGEVSKEEAFRGSGVGGSIVDSLYFNEWIPSLRQNGVVFFPEAVECLGNRLDLELEDNEFFWVDCNPFNGFTYYYAITTFDRGYNVPSPAQGLFKVESCLPDAGMPWDCRDDLMAVEINVRTQSNLAKVYAVPNPYRTGGSRFTVQEYRNYPDEKVRFVNVPDVCKIKIYTVAGDLVWEAEHDDPVRGNIEWDVRNDAGEEVTSGVYVYRIEDTSGNEVYGRLVIIR